MKKKYKKLLKILLSITLVVLFICSILFNGKLGIFEVIFIIFIAYFLTSLIKEINNKLDLFFLFLFFLIQAMILLLFTRMNDPRAIKAYVSALGYVLFIPSISWYFWIKNENLVKRITLIITNSGVLFYFSRYGFKHTYLHMYNSTLGNIFIHSLPILGLIYFIFSVLLLWMFNLSIIKKVLTLRKIGLLISIPLTFYFSIIYIQSSLYIPIGARVSNVEYSNYTSSIIINKNGSITGSQRVQMNFDWENDDDLLYDESGQLLPWTDQPEINQEIIREGYTDWIVEKNWVDLISENKYSYNFIFISNNLVSEKRKIGLIRFVHFIDIDHSATTNSFNSDYTRNIEYILEVPKDMIVNHNLNGQFIDSIDENGFPIKRLNAEEISSFNKNKIILSYIHPNFQNKLFNFLFELSISDIFFWILTFLISIIVVYLGVINEILKKEKIEPLARKILIKLKIINNNESLDESNTNNNENI